ncbi:hypothetical protein KIF24_20600 [Micromonospora sp. Llam7]|uniref:EutN/CcmL family microcompartment protein n=1 Tax=Micromonospora tarapacensis TaxID=2835305 RepID=UPI001C82BAC2|nr:hypothetical protein [Micromonospora tarapacensis]
MFIGTVTGSVVVATGRPGLVGRKLLRVAVDEADRHGTILVVDVVGAGAGDRVLLALGDGPAAIGQPGVPTDAVVVGILEQGS